VSRAGFVALVGEPNAGKSTLFNRLVGHSLAAVTRRPQTTRFSIPAIVNKEGVQYIFVDTPGWVASPRKAWHRLLTRQSLAAAQDADVRVWVVSAQGPAPVLPDEVAVFLSTASALVGAVTHLDVYPPSERTTRWEALQAQLAEWPVQTWVDASIDRPLEPLFEVIAPLLPESPPLYPPDQLTSLPVRFFVAEILREVLYTHLHEELPYGTEVEITQYRETPERDHIYATIFVEKESHKPMVIGSKGQMIKRIGTEARKKMEHFLQKPVFLQLYVKVAPNWRDSMSRLRHLGYKGS